MSIKNVTVIGGGILGSQIAFQTAYKGFSVTIYATDDQSLNRVKERIAAIPNTYVETINIELKDVENISETILYTPDLKKAVENADLVIESVPEVATIKIELYKKLSPLLPKKTILVTNSSTLLPSELAAATGRPEKYLALHFANQILKYNTAEIMKHSGTDDSVFQTIIEFAKQIDMVPIPIYKEQSGYVLNSLLVPLLTAAQTLWVNDIATVETIDKTWMIILEAPLGPFGILDIVGLKTAYNIANAHGSKNPIEKIIAAKIKSELLDKGKFGRESGEGYYKYPNPAFLKPDFLKS